MEASHTADTVRMEQTWILRRQTPCLLGQVQCDMSLLCPQCSLAGHMLAITQKPHGVISAALCLLRGGGLLTDTKSYDNSTVKSLDWHWLVYSQFIWQARKFHLPTLLHKKCLLSCSVIFDISSYLWTDWASAFCDFSGSLLSKWG